MSLGEFLYQTNGFLLMFPLNQEEPNKEKKTFHIFVSSSSAAFKPPQEETEAPLRAETNPSASCRLKPASVEPTRTNKEPGKP